MSALSSGRSVWVMISRPPRTSRSTTRHRSTSIRHNASELAAYRRVARSGAPRTRSRKEKRRSKGVGSLLAKSLAVHLPVYLEAASSVARHAPLSQIAILEKDKRQKNRRRHVGGAIQGRQADVLCGDNCVGRDDRRL